MSLVAKYRNSRGSGWRRRVRRAASTGNALDIAQRWTNGVTPHQDLRAAFDERMQLRFDKWWRAQRERLAREAVTKAITASVLAQTAYRAGYELGAANTKNILKERSIEAFQAGFEEALGLYRHVQDAEDEA